MVEDNDIIERYLAGPDIHEVRKAGLIGAGLSMFVSLAAVLVHGFNTYLMFWTEMPLIIALLIHFVAGFAVILFAVALHKVGRDTRFMMLLGVATITTGVFGAVGTLFSVLLHFWHMRLAQTFSEWFITIFPKNQRDPSEEVYDNIMFGRDENPLAYNVMPFLEVLEVGSEAQKREAISRMTEGFSPEFAPAFSRALNDDSNSIRVQAATSIAKIEKQFMDRLMKITEVADRHPDDRQVKLILAEHYDNYAFTGILDSERERINRHRALKTYQEYLEAEPNNINIIVKVGRLLLRDNRAIESAEWFKKNIENGNDSDSLKIWYFEALYASGNYDELRSLSRSFSSVIAGYEDIRPQLVSSIKLWAGEKYMSEDSEVVL